MKNAFIFILPILFLKTAAQNPGGGFFVGDSLFAIGKYADAITNYEKAEPETADIQIKIAHAYQALGNFGQALAYYEKALSKGEKKTATASDYGKLLFRTKHFKKADRVFEALTKRFPKNPDFHYRLGLAKKHLGDSTAVLSFQKAFSLNNTHQNAIYELAVLHFKNKNFGKVRKLGQKALESYPGNMEIISLLGQNAMAMREYQLVIGRFEKLVSLNQGSEFVFEKLGLAHYHLGDLEKATVYYQKALALDPQNPNTHFVLGKIYNLLGKPDRAEVFLKMGLLLKKKGLDRMYEALGNAFKLKKDYASAIENYKLALNENPFNFLAQYGLALAADNYYKDPQTRLNYYQIFVEKFEGFPNVGPYLDFAEYRIGELKKEIHLSGEKAD